MSKNIYFETFETKHDADHWIDGHIEDYKNKGWHLVEARVKYVPRGWVATCMFSTEQLELDLEAYDD